MATKDALLRLTARLIRRRDALLKSLQGDIDTLRTVSAVDGVGDQVDAAVDAENNEICSQLAELESRELGRIEHALQGISGGGYGRCEYCGGKIPAARLNALPYANSCIECQREVESRGKPRGPDLESEHWARIDGGRIDEGDMQIKLSRPELESDE